MVIDINNDGVSLFENRPTFFNSGTQSDLFRAFNSGGSDSIKDGSVITLDVDTKGGRDITVILYLEQIREPDLDEVVK